MFEVIIDKSKHHPYIVVDKCEPEGKNEVAAFLSREKAIAYSNDQNRIRELSCCERSIHSLGWHHDHNCKGTYEKPVVYNKIRDYYNENGTVTNFAQVSQFKWECTHGGWVGEIISEDELTMEHVYGTVSYTSFVEREEME